MDAQEFRKDFLENIKAEAAATGEGSCAAFVGSVAQYLVEAEVLPDFTPAFYTSTTSKRKIYRVDGYVFDEFDYTMNLIIADYDGVEERTMGKVVSSTNFQRLAVFVDQALNTNLYREIEMSTPCADLVDLLRLEKERIRKYRLLIFTDADVSDTLKNLDSLDIGGIPAECQIWDIDRVFRVCCSDLGRQNIEIDFREYIPAGIPCLEASSAATAEYNSYLCIIPGKVLADIYDKYGSQLLEGNVRSFLSTKVAVNKKIRETILKCPSMFFAYNNGVSATAMDVQLERTAGGTHIVGARDFQIINGGQTTASLSNTRHKDKADLEGIYVQMKLTEIDESDMDRSTELVRNISRSSNTKALEQIAEQVFYRITDPNRPTINVTQWCKREGCWNSVQEINLILPAEFSSVLIGKTEVRAAEKEARKDQKVLSETEAQVKVLQYSADQWKKLSAFVMQKRMASPDENVALKYACQIPNKMPSGYQSQRLLALLDRALSEGFNL